MDACVLCTQKKLMRPLKIKTRRIQRKLTLDDNGSDAIKRKKCACSYSDYGVKAFFPLVLNDVVVIRLVTFDIKLRNANSRPSTHN